VLDRHGGGSADIRIRARTFGSEGEALAEWRDATGTAATSATLAECEPDMAGWLLGSGLQTGALADMSPGGEPDELRQETFRYRRRAQALANAELITDAGSESEDGGIRKPAGRFWNGDYKDGARRVRNQFRNWHAERHGKRAASVSQGTETIISEWGPHDPFDERAFFSCSPHRVEYAAHLISNGYLDDDADRAIRLLPDWVQWCAERSRISAEAAEPALAAARAAADLAAEKGPDSIPDPVQGESPYLRAE
jgi:hypothetical protein